MSRKRQITQIKARMRAENSLAGLNHAELTARARALGCPPFCGTWSDEALIRNIQEKENGTVQ